MGLYFELGPETRPEAEGRRVSRTLGGKMPSGPSSGGSSFPLDSMAVSQNSGMSLEREPSAARADERGKEEKGTHFEAWLYAQQAITYVESRYVGSLALLPLLTPLALSVLAPVMLLANL